MAFRMLTAASAIAIALSGCAGYDLPVGPPRHYSGSPPYGPEQGPSSTQIAARAPVYVPPPVPQRRSVAIEYYAGQPLVRISFPGVASFRCVLDTGASDLVIPLPFLVKLGGNGLNPNTDMEWLGAGRSQLAGGGVIKHVNVSFHRIDIGPWTLRNVPASIIPDGDCLLGMSVLKAFGHPMIDFANQRLILED